MNRPHRDSTFLLLWLLAPAALTGADFQATQTAFTESDGKNTVVLEWTDSAEQPGQVQVKNGAVVIAAVTGVSGKNAFTFEETVAGEHTYSAEGLGGSLGSQVQTVLESPSDMIGAPAQDKMHCRTEGSGEDCEIVIDWETGNPPPTQYDVLLDGELHLVKFDLFPTKVQFAATTGGEHRVTIQPVVVRTSPPDVGRFERPAIECTLDVPCAALPGNRFVRGSCNGAGSNTDGKPDISSSIFGLSYLFLGGPAPPCAEACDANASGGPGEPFDLSDMVFGLNFLFLGGPAPPTWGGASPVCETAGPGDDCRESHAFCAQ